jgi:2,3-bisphosphoglycerate-dependent phosphoglycerate mutase
VRIYFARHGESEANLLRLISNRELPHHLTERGREQARALANELRGAGVARIYSSPIPRARETAGIVGGALGLPFAVTEALREYDCGVAEGRADDEAWALYAAADAGWRRGALESRVPGGESFLDMRARFVPFVERLVADRERIGGDVLLIGHGGLYRCMLPLVLLGVTPEQARATPFGNCQYVLAAAAADGLRCERYCGAPLAALTNPSSKPPS